MKYYNNCKKRDRFLTDLNFCRRLRKFPTLFIKTEIHSDIIQMISILDIIISKKKI